MRRQTLEAMMDGHGRRRLLGIALALGALPGVAMAQQPPAGAPAVLAVPSLEPVIPQPPPGSPAVPTGAPEIQIPQPVNLQPKVAGPPTTVTCKEFPKTRSQRCTGPDGKVVDLHPDLTAAVEHD
jgi:hypothetical protein